MGVDRSLGKQVEGTSNGFLGLGASIKDAIDKALVQAGAEYDLLIDGVIRQNDYVFVVGYTVEGTAVSLSKLRAELGDEGFEEWCSRHNVFLLEEADQQLATK